MRRLRVLISAHEFSPNQGSECAVGWNICTRMAAYHDVTVLCASGPPQHPSAYRQAVSHYYAEHGIIPGLKIVFVNQPPITLRCAAINRKLFDVSDGAGFRPFFYMGLDAWHREAFRTAIDLGIDKFDVVHQLTPVGFRNPGYLWKTNVPFVWGPIGGMHKVPADFARWLGIRSFIFETCRSIGTEWQARMSPSVRRAAQKATLVWAITENERHSVKRMAGDKAFPMIEAASSSEIPGRVRQYDSRRPLRVCWSGRHDAPKALPLFLYALAHLSEPRQVILDVLGGGSETQRWEGLSRHLSLQGITWHGQLAYRDALERMGQADLFVHTSTREATSTVVLEALSLGLPVMCHDACGMALAIDDTCGIKVPFVCPEQSILGFRNALNQILQEPGLIQKLSEGALRRASALSWDSKVKQLAESYIHCTQS